MTIILNGTTGITTPATIATTITSPAATPLTIQSAGVTAITVDTSQNVGLGVTPSAWSSGKAIEVGAIGTGIYTYGTANTFYTSNAYFNGSWKYSASNYASQYNQYNGTHAWFTAPSGTAGNPITFTQAMTLDGTGANTDLYLTATGGTNGNTRIRAVSNGDLAFITGLNERARIDSGGNLLVGTTASNVTSGGFWSGINASGTGISQLNIGHITGASSGTGFLQFFYAGGGIGGITQSGTTGVAYNTTSDYRLKENVTPMTGALARINALKPCTYTWKMAPDEIGEGFLAHELAEVCPQATTGEKDAVDKDGKPVYQSIDTSFLVATLTAAIQEQQALITSLTTRLTALENK